MFKDFFSLALNNFRRRKLRSWLTLIGIFIGIASIVSLISLGQGLQTAVMGQFSSLSTDKLTIQNAGTGFGPPGSTVIKKLNEHDLDLIKKISGVEYAIPRLLRSTKLEYNDNVEFKYSTSIPYNLKEREIIYESQDLKVESGRLLKEEDSGKVVIGGNIVSKDEFGKEIKVGKKIKIQDKEFEVVGILKKSGSFQTNDIVLMSESDLKEILNIDDEIDFIIAQVKNPEEITEVAERIEKKFRDDRNLKVGEEDFSVETPLEAISSVNTILTSINVIIIGIAMISLIVGGIGIANTMYTSVLERRMEIGVMKSIGAKNSDILSIFLLESGLIGLIGGVVGVLIGMGLSFSISSAANNYFGSEIIKPIVSIPLIILAVNFAFLIGLLSGLVPSIQASKLKPVDALRG